MNSWYNIGLWTVLQGSTTLSSATVKALLVNSTYTFDKDHATVAAIVAGSKEVSATNYTGGAGGSGRKAVTLSFGSSPNNTDNRVDIGVADITWNLIGGATNTTVTGLVLYLHNSGSNDALNIPLAHFIVNGSGSGYVTNGSDFLADFAAQSAGGNLRLLI